MNLAFANFLQYDIGGVLHGLHVPGINPSLWTLKIELGFYLIVPLVFLAIRRWGFKSLLAIFLASVVYEVVALHLGDPRFAKQLPGQMQFFVVGMALYLYVREFPRALLGIRDRHGRLSGRVDLAGPDPARTPPAACRRVRVLLRALHAGGCACAATCPTASISCTGP